MLAGLSEETFAGIRVLDLTRLLPGPFCTMLLAELGAEVIKIEAPQGGDYARWYPPVVDDAPGGYGAFFSAVNRGKRSVALDLKDSEARQAFERLLLTADVVVEGFRPGVMERLQLGPDRLRAINPSLIFCRISGFGQTGPDAHRAGHDLGYLARSGILGLTGPVGLPPQMPAAQVADLAGGALYAAFAIAAALFQRTRRATGVVLDISMTEGASSLMNPHFATARVAGSPPRGAAMLSGGWPCYRCYETADGRYLAVSSLEPQFWNTLCLALQRPDLLPHAMDEGEAGRRVMADLEAVFRQRTLAQWREVLRGLDACVEPVLTLDELVADAQLVARRAVGPDGEVRPPTRPVGALPGRVPRLGADTRAVLEAVGVEAATVASLVARGVAGGPV